MSQNADGVTRDSNVSSLHCVVTHRPQPLAGLTSSLQNRWQPPIRGGAIRVSNVLTLASFTTSRPVLAKRIAGLRVALSAATAAGSRGTSRRWRRCPREGRSATSTPSGAAS